MKKSQLAVQCYTLREFLKTPADIAKSMAKVKAIGYDVVQLSGVGPIEESEMVKILKDNGLTCCATHEPGVDIVDNVQKVIDRLAKLNCKYTAYPYPHMLPKSYEEAIELAKKLNASAEKMAAAGQVLCYHNHACEFEKFNGEYMLDIFYDNAPALMCEIDTFWIQAGGCNPAEWVKKFPGRQPLLHLKDYGIVANERTMRPIGQGSLNWREIIPAGEAAGVEYFIVEQDVCQKDPFESVKDSYEYIMANFVK